MPLPTGPEPYGATRQLFATISQTIKDQTGLSVRESAVVTCWVLTTWLHDALPVAPGLAITGCPHKADILLRTLRGYCYHPVLLMGLTETVLNSLRTTLYFTLLVNEPGMTTRTAALLSSSTARGYLTHFKPGCIPDHFGPKAVYCGKDLPPKLRLTRYLHIHVTPASTIESKPPAIVSEESMQTFQNQLLWYRLNNLSGASASAFVARDLSAECNEIASAFAKCIVDDPELQAECVALLAPYSEQQLAEHRDDLGILVIEATLSLCHRDKKQILVAEIAQEANRVLEERGERMELSPEKIGHRLKKAGLVSKRISAAGNGFLLDQSTLARIHEVAAQYGCGGSSSSENNQQ